MKRLGFTHSQLRCLSCIPTALAIFLLLQTLNSSAQNSTPPDASSPEDFVSWVDPHAKSELWLNAGMASYHFQQNQSLNGANWGLGGEYRFLTVASVTAGRFYNSDRAYSNYAGLYYQPLAIGPITLGVVMGGFSGYPAANHGGWFAAVLPALTYEGDIIGANLFIIPTIGDRVHGAISLQLKIKAWG